MNFIRKHRFIGLGLISIALLFSCTPINDLPVSTSQASVNGNSSNEEVSSLESSSSSSSSNTSIDTVTHYNIIFTLATIPPVLAALESLQNNYETYAMIERGTTYRGIGAIEQDFKFHNIGFDINSNASGGFGEEKFNATVNKIKDLNKKGDEIFHIYLRDADVNFGFGLASNAGLKNGQYELMLCEDGSATYVHFKNKYVNGKKVTLEHDEPYEQYLTNVAKWASRRDTILSKTDNKYRELDNSPNDFDGCAASSLDHVTWRIQNKNQLVSSLQAVGNTKLLSAIGAENHHEQVDKRAKIISSSISSVVKNLQDVKKDAYITLMYGDYKDDTIKALTRAKLDDNTTSVPSKKLVFIGSRIKSSPTIASSSNYGIGGAISYSDIKDSYASLNSKYKTPLLFGSEQDYQVFLDVVNNTQNYKEGITETQKQEVRKQIFNYYIDYMFTLKFTHAMYGKDYDIIIKGHPSEVLGSSSTWTNHYEISNYRYDDLMEKLAFAFHEKDSIGKYIGRVPYGTAAENLAYLGADISIGGLDSSTYQGYEQEVDVKFLLMLTDDDITKNTNIGERYNSGTLLNHSSDGTLIKPTYFNNGYLLKALVKYYESNNLNDLKKSYENLLNAWLNKMGATDVDEQGIITKKSV